MMKERLSLNIEEETPLNEIKGWLLEMAAFKIKQPRSQFIDATSNAFISAGRLVLVSNSYGYKKELEKIDLDYWGHYSRADLRAIKQAALKKGRL